MRFRKNLLFILAAGAASFGPAAAQEFKSEASVQYFGAFVWGTTAEGVQQSATETGGVLASYRYLINKYGGVEVNYGWAPGTQKYFFANSVTRVRANSDEATGALFLRYPGHRVAPFALLGAGALVFDPQIAPQTEQARAAFLYGIGADVNFTHRFFLRAGYRGLVYESPDFNTPHLGPERITHRAEPSIGFGVRF